MSRDVVRFGAVCGLLAIVGSDAAAGGQSDAVLSAPYQVEAVSRSRDRFDETPDLGTPRVVVDLGSAEDKPWPDRDAYSTMTLIGTAGTMTAHLEDIVKTCEALCGDEAEECHYVAQLLPAGDPETLGDPVAAFAGLHTLADFAPTPGSVPQPQLDRDSLSSQLLPPAWPTSQQGVPRYRFRRHDGALIMDSQYGVSDIQEVSLGECGFYDRGALVRMVCDGAEALIADGLPVLVSFPDYNIASADVLASLAHGEQTYYVVRLAIKAQTIYGLLYEDGGRWHARFRPRDYALLC